MEQWEGPEEKTSIQKFLYPEPEDLPDDFSMPIWDHLDELRERVIVAALAAATAVLTCFCFSKDLVVFLEAPVAQQGVRFLQLSPGEFFFTTIKVRQQPISPFYLKLFSRPTHAFCDPLPAEYTVEIQSSQ